jgi:hypothetical protein
MRIFSFAATAALTLSIALAGSTSATAQAAANAPHHPRILGYQDMQTGAFHPLRRTLPETSAGKSPFGGTIEVTLNITLAVPLSAGQTVYCSIYIEEDSYLSNTTTYEDTDGYSYEESASVTATKNGKLYTCTLTIPYSWTIPTKTSKTSLVSSLGGNYYVDVSSTSTEGDSRGVPLTTAPAEQTSRELSGTLVLPATLTTTDGAKTTLPPIDAAL